MRARCKMASIFRKVLVSERLPELGLKTLNCFVTDTSGATTFIEVTPRVRERIQVMYKWWLEEIELPDTSQFKPCDDDAHDQYNEHSDVYEAGYSDGFKDGKVEGINYLLNHLK